MAEREGEAGSVDRMSKEEKNWAGWEGGAGRGE